LKESVVLADIQHRELGKMRGKAGEALGLSQDAKIAKKTHCGSQLELELKVNTQAFYLSTN